MSSKHGNAGHRHITIALDYVMMVTDPAQLPGGRFEYFRGTKGEAAALAAEGRTPPPDFPGPGYAIALHGNMVVHRRGRSEERRALAGNGGGGARAAVRRRRRDVVRDRRGVQPPPALRARPDRDPRGRKPHRRYPLNEAATNRNSPWTARNTSTGSAASTRARLKSVPSQHRPQLRQRFWPSVDMACTLAIRSASATGTLKSSVGKRGGNGHLNEGIGG